MPSAFFMAVTAATYVPAGGGGDSGAHNNWRIRTRFNEGHLNQYAEIYFLDSGDVDQNGGGTAIKSSENGSLTAAKAFDRNNATDWQSVNNTAEWIGYQWPTGKEVAKVGVRGSASNPTFNAKGLLFEYSNDGVNWTLMQDITDPLGNLTAGGYREYTLAAVDYTVGDNSGHRYWRIRFLAINSGNASTFEIDEIEFQNPIGTDVTGSGTAIASSNSGTAGNAFSNSSAEHWIGYDFGSGVTTAIKGVKVKSSSVQSKAPTDFVLEYSDDNVSWTPKLLCQTEFGASQNTFFNCRLTVEAAVTKVEKFAVFQRKNPMVSKVSKVAVMSRKNPFVSKVAKYVVAKAH
jgi:hypothetical protein